MAQHPSQVLHTHPVAPKRQSGNGICLLFCWAGSEFPVTKTEQTLAGTCPLGATGDARLDPFGRNCTVTVRAFLFPNQEIQVEALLPDRQRRSTLPLVDQYERAAETLFRLGRLSSIERRSCNP